MNGTADRGMGGNAPPGRLFLYVIIQVGTNAMSLI